MEPYRVLEGEALGRLQRNKTPKQVYARGGLDLNDARPAVAIVGSRDPTATGLEAARDVARQMVRAGYAVVSGGARGIDQAAHLAALEAGGKTVAVLGNPAKIRGDERPVWMREAFDAARDRALTVTPFGPDVRHSKGLFAGRNRHIAALADEVVVVEGRVKSGTFYTVNAAIGLGVRVWGIGGTTPASHAPCFVVDQAKARLLRPWEAAAMLTGQPPPPPTTPAPQAALPFAGTAPLVAAIRKAGGRLLVDDAARILGLGIGTLLGDAAVLELDGALRREGPFLVA